MELQDVISELVGEAYPPAVEVNGRLRRNWVARTASALPSEVALNDLQRVIEEDAFGKIREAYSSVATPEELVNVRPSVALVRLDDHHLLVRIEFAGPGKSVGDAAAISQWGVLQFVDRLLPLDELQGLPCKHWFALRVGRYPK